jgi:hypothetical protein
MEAGFLTIVGLLGPTPRLRPRLAFVSPGEATATNPVLAFKQGLLGVPQNEAYLVGAQRCASCGAVELIATERTDCPP